MVNLTKQVLQKPKKTVIISLGGSLIVPDKINISYLKQFRKFINSYIKQGYKFVIVCGGGHTAREYINAAVKIAGEEKSLNNELDLIGIKATFLNAELVKSIFYNYNKKIVFPEIITNPDKTPNKLTKKIYVIAGWKPGFSSDYDAVYYAIKFKSDTVINLTNVDHVYSSDPRKNKSAKPLPSLTWKDYLGIVGNKWQAGDNFPFDPVASKLASKHNIKVYIIKGTLLTQLRNILEQKHFKGTLLHN